MKRIRVNLKERSYDVIIGYGALAEAGAAASVCRGRRSVVVSNPIVADLHGDTLIKSLSEAGFEIHILTVPAGEEHKTLETVASLYEGFLDLQLDRSSVVFALGGGVVGDMAGFAAATYLRGIDVVQVPTTLLAQVDAGVGGKTGVDLPRGKNLVGAFHQPRAVVIDTAVLRTLPEREYRAGLAEVVKHGIITDPAYFEFLESNLSGILDIEPEIIDFTVARSVEIKADVVSRDELETSDLRKSLNLGHTFAHGVEVATGYGQYLHGEAVSVGLVAAADVAEAAGIAEAGTSKRISRLLESLGLPSSPGAPVDVNAVLSAIRLDKKASRGKINYVLPRCVGEVIVTDEIPDHIIEDILRRWA